MKRKRKRRSSNRSTRSRLVLLFVARVPLLALERQGTNSWLDGQVYTEPRWRRKRGREGDLGADWRPWGRWTDNRDDFAAVQNARICRAASARARGKKGEAGWESERCMVTSRSGSRWEDAEHAGYTLELRDNPERTLGIRGSWGARRRAGSATNTMNVGKSILCPLSEEGGRRGQTVFISMLAFGCTNCRQRLLHHMYNKATHELLDKGIRRIREVCTVLLDVIVGVDTSGDDAVALAG